MPPNTPDSLIDDPHLKAVGFFKQIEHPSEATLYDVAVPATWSSTQSGPERFASRLGEHSVEILQEIGLSDAEISSMMQNDASKDPSFSSNEPATEALQ